MARSLNAIRDKYREIYGGLGVDIPSQIGVKKHEKGTTTKNLTAMNHLYQIVGTSNLKQDIKRIKNAQTLEGAKGWIKSNKKEGYYTATEEDIDKDGINDVVIKDVNGNLVVVNGYTIRNSDYPYRQMFYNQPKEVRKDYNSYKQWVNDAYYGPVYNDETGEVDDYRYHKPKDDKFTINLHNKGFKTLIPKSKTPYQLFTSLYVKRMYEYVIKRHNLYTADGKKPNVFIKLASIIWNNWVLKPALMVMYPDDTNIDEIMENTKLFNKIKSKADFKKYILLIVNNYVEHSDDTNKDLLDDIYDEAIKLIDDWFNTNEYDKCDNFGGENQNVEWNPVVPQSPQKPRNEQVENEDEI